MRIINGNEAKAVIESLMAGAKSHYEGFGTSEKPDSHIADGVLYLSPAVYELITKKAGYFFLFPEYVKIKGVEYLACYYLKVSEYGSFPFTPIVDERHRVYVYCFIRNKRSGALTQGPYTQRASEMESHMILEKWAKHMDGIKA